MARVTLYKSQMDLLLDNPNGPVGRMLKRRGGYVLRGAKRQVGVNTGNLRRSIHMRHFRDSRGQYVKIGSDENYALAHHQGTRPHIIRPNRAQVLKFETRGQTFFRNIVRHPGTKANKYLTDNLRLILLP